MTRPIATMNFGAQLELSEAEVRVLSHLAGYGSGLVVGIQEHVTRSFDAKVLRELLERWNREGAACIARFDAARKPFKEAKSEACLATGAAA